MSYNFEQIRRLSIAQIMDTYHVAFGIAEGMRKGHTPEETRAKWREAAAKHKEKLMQEQPMPLQDAVTEELERWRDSTLKREVDALADSIGDVPPLAWRRIQAVYWLTHGDAAARDAALQALIKPEWQEILTTVKMFMSAVHDAFDGDENYLPNATPVLRRTCRGLGRASCRWWWSLRAADR